MQSPEGTFTHRHLGAVDRRVHRMGLALNYGIDGKGVAEALERGVNYLFYTGLRTGRARPVLRDALARDRESFVVAAGATLGLYRSAVRRAAEATLRKLGTDYIDVFHLFWLGTTSAWTEGTREALLALREEGKLRAVGISIHDRPRAGRLAEEPGLDLLMIRYNAAHPGAERDIFPHLDRRRPSIVAYTATSWRKLLAKPRDWEGRPMTAGKCYRFCLSNPHVDVVLTGPKNQKELRENLAAIESGPLSTDELAWMRRFGAAVHG
jgi:aryl-alcohol dehydrogenase-like predicted oxidoreductase